MKKYTNEELFQIDAVSVYKMVLRGNAIDRFPKGFWQQAEAKQNAARCIRYLVEEVLKYDDEMLKKNYSYSFIIKYKLKGMVKACFNDSPYKALDNAYPSKYKEWEFNQVCKNCWANKDNGIKAVKWLIEEKLKLSDEELKQQFSKELFVNNGLSGMLQSCFNDSPYEAINNTYPNKFKVWEFKQTSRSYWENKDNGIRATKWLIEEKLKLNDEELKKQLSQKLFIDNGLNGMLQHSFKGSAYEAINSIYPNKFKVWEFKQVKRNYWRNKNNGIRATKWLIEEKLKLTDEELKQQLCTKLFINNGLNGMLQHCSNSSPYEAINNAYPNKFKQWEFKCVPNGFWDNKENQIRAIKWLIEEKLKLNDEQLKEELSATLFIKNGLRGMLQTCFNYSPYEAINAAYPNKFKKEDFKNYKK